MVSTCECGVPELLLPQVGRDTGTGTESERIKIKLTIEVDNVDFDAQGMALRAANARVGADTGRTCSAVHGSHKCSVCVRLFMPAPESASYFLPVYDPFCTCRRCDTCVR